MRVLWYSNAIWGHSGYANASRLVVQHLAAAGHAVGFLCNWGLRGGVLGSEAGIKFYPGGYDARSNDVIQSHADDFRADIIVSLYDVWPLKPANLRTPWAAWAPIDHQPAPENVIEALRGATYPVAFSEFGLVEMQRAGLSHARYIPLPVDTKAYTPGDQAEARARIGLPADRFIVGLVGTNVTYPARKCIPQVLQAFAEFKRQHRDALLYLHTEESGVQGGIRLRPLLDALGLGPEDVVVCDQYHYLTGFPDDYLVDAYRALDVLAQPSMAEGFGLPIMEAQACGTPVIATDNTSMTELVAGGWLLTDIERWWSPQGGWQSTPHEAGIISALSEAYATKHDRAAEWAERRLAARDMAEGYAAEIIGQSWDAFLHEVSQ